jgi:hypothetical protein
VSWNDGNERFTAELSGEIEFTDDDRDVKSLSSGGYLYLEQRMRSERRRVEIRSKAGGSLERAWFVDGRQQPWDSGAQEWLARELPDFIRRSAIGARPRVKRILASQGVDGVLTEITQIPGDWAQRIYFTALLEQTTLNPATAQQILGQAAREISSDFELAELLVTMAPQSPPDGPVGLAYVEATNSIDSDFERRRALTALIKQRPPFADVARAALQSAGRMTSDFELAEFLALTAGSGPLGTTTQAEFLTAIGTIQSDFEKRRALTALVKAGQLSPDALAGVLRTASRMSSSFELASLLITVADAARIDAARSAYFEAVDAIDSDFERRRALTALIKRADLSAETLEAAIASASRMSSSFELASFLVTVAGQHDLSGTVRAAYLRASERITSDFEQNRALAALAQAERKR